MKVGDAMITPTKADWKGIVVDVYISKPGSKIVNQVVIPISGTGVVTDAIQYQMGKKQGNIKLKDSRVILDKEKGFTISALIPLSVFGLAEGEKTFSMEISTTMTSSPERARNWRSLFGSVSAFVKSERFRPCKF